MSVFKDSPQTQVRTPIAVGVILTLVVVLSAFFYYREHPATPTVPPGNASPAAKAPAAAPATPAPAPREETAAKAGPAPAAPRKAPAAKPAPVAETPAASTVATRATLTVESDVPGASVFVNRQFVGNAPLTLDNVEPGQKQINMVADGFDGITRSVDVPAGPQTVTMRFKEVRLDKRISVTHKHGVGSCSGDLVATVDGLRYVTSNAKDAGTIPFAALEQFEVNYLEKNLRVKQKGGRTWNFTNGEANADALFVFQRDVDAARKKLAQGYAPVR